MNEGRINFFAIPVFTFIPQKYRELVNEKGGRVFAALLIWFLILNIITGFVASNAIEDMRSELEKGLPDFELRDSVLTIAEPFVYDDEDVYVEVSEELSGITAAMLEEKVKNGDKTSIMLFGRDSAGMYSEGQTRVLKYSDFPNFKVSKDIVCNRWLPMLKPAMMVFFVFSAFVSIGFYYLAAVILQLPASFMAKQFFGFELDNTERFRLTVLAKFPVYVVVYVVEKFGLSVNFWVNLILQLAMIALVLNFYRKDDAKYDIVS